MNVSRERKTGVHAGHVLGVGLGAAPVVSILAPQGLTLLCVGTAAGLLVAAAVARRAPRIVKTLLWPLALLIGYAAVTSIWAPRPAESLWLAASIAALFGSGLILVGAIRTLDAAEWRFVRGCFVAGFAAGLLLLMFETESNAKITFFLRDIAQSTPRRYPDSYGRNVFNRAATVLALFLWPAVMLALRARLIPLAVGLLAIGFYLATRTGSSSAVVAIVVGGAVLAVALRRPRRTPLVLAGVFAAGMMLAPLLIEFAMWIPGVADFAAAENSFGHRLRIWQYAVGKIWVHPVLGWGLDAARHLNTGGFGLGAQAELMPLHPHNGPLQIWLELGVLGALAAAGVIVAMCLAIHRAIRDVVARACSAAALSSAVTVGSLSYGVWQYWWLAALWLGAGLILLAAVAPAGTPAAPERGANDA